MENILKSIPVVILCGGRGMRLNEHTVEVPKPMVEIGGMPILWHIMKIYAANGFRRFILCLGYRGEKIRDYFVHLRWRQRDCTVHLRDDCPIEYHQPITDDWTITFAETGPDAETGARLKQVEKYVDTDTFLMTYGDGVSDLSIKALLSTHEQHRRHATVTCVRPKTHFGIVEMNREGIVTRYQEKPNLTTYASGGFFCLTKEVFPYIEGNEAFERGPMQRLIAKDQLGAHIHEGFWGCMDTFKDYRDLNELWARGEAPWRTW